MELVLTYHPHSFGSEEFIVKKLKDLLEAASSRPTRPFLVPDAVVVAGATLAHLLLKSAKVFLISTLSVHEVFS